MEQQGGADLKIDGYKTGWTLVPATDEPKSQQSQQHGKGSARTKLSVRTPHSAREKNGSHCTYLKLSFFLVMPLCYTAHHPYAQAKADD